MSKFDELKGPLPMVDKVGSVKGSPKARHIAIGEVFLPIHYRKGNASSNAVKDHVAFRDCRTTYVGTACKREYEFQCEVRVNTKNVYPPSGANMVKSVQYLSRNAPEVLEKVASELGLTVEELSDAANSRFQSELKAREANVEKEECVDVIAGLERLSQSMRADPFW